MPKYKVWFLVAGERTYATNQLEFDSVEEALEKEARPRFYAWTLTRKYAVVSTEAYSGGCPTPEVLEPLAEVVYPS